MKNNIDSFSIKIQFTLESYKNIYIKYKHTYKRNHALQVQYQRIAMFKNNNTTFGMKYAIKLLKAAEFRCHRIGQLNKFIFNGNGTQ